MTTFVVPPSGSPVWRGIYPTPPEVRFEVGPFCPLDDTHLHREPLNERPGWMCPTCLAWWDLRGRHGRWLAARTVEGQVLAVVDGDPAAVARLRRVDRWAAGAVGAGAVAGLGYAAGRAVRPHADLVPDDLIWALAGVLAAAAVVLLVVAVLLRWHDARRYAGNELLGPTGSEVSDGR